MRITRMSALAISLMVVALLSVGVASAAPSNAPTAATFLLECDNGQSYPIVVNGNGAFTPGHITDGNGGMVIPVAFTIEVTDADGNVVFSDSIAKPGQMRGLTGDLFDCTFEDTDDGFTILGAATVFLTPRR